MLYIDFNETQYKIEYVTIPGEGIYNVILKSDEELIHLQELPTYVQEQVLDLIREDNVFQGYLE